MSLVRRRIRLKAVWLLLIPFLVFARPTPLSLVAGAGLALVGGVIRAWAAGCIAKDRELAVTGPYAHTRNPLYLGSCLIGTGVTLAGGSWIFVALFLTYFVLVYGRTIRAEERILAKDFGVKYERYRAGVPRFLPRLRPYRPEPDSAVRSAMASAGGGVRSGSGAGVGDGNIAGDDTWARSREETEEAKEVEAAVGIPSRRSRFSIRRYLRNREWEAALGVAAGFAALAVKMLWQ